MLRRKKGQGGYFVTIEVIVLATCLLCVLVAFCGVWGSKIVGEAADVAAAIGALNQSYTITGVAVGHPNDPFHPTDVAFWAGSFYTDGQDYCDQSANCGVRMCIPPTPEGPPGP